MGAYIPLIIEPYNHRAITGRSALPSLPPPQPTRAPPPFIQLSFRRHISSREQIVFRDDKRSGSWTIRDGMERFNFLFLFLVRFTTRVCHRWHVDGGMTIHPGNHGYRSPPRSSAPLISRSLTRYIRTHTIEHRIYAPRLACAPTCVAHGLRETRSCCIETDHFSCTLIFPFPSMHGVGAASPVHFRRTRALNVERSNAG